ncbi:MAG: glycosyltransferase family 2 protein, partial [Flavobacteriales bacterium]|nr:glycosyltransferase family 2 protein [Flavobacteriales bacterium]
MKHLPLVTVIIPCYNEGAFIGPFLDSMATQDYPGDQLEILIADGMSTDGTRNEIQSRITAASKIILIDNPKRYVPHGLNLCLARAQGEVIVRMDVHCQYPDHYISACVRHLLESGADNCGGVLDTVPGADTPEAQSIAIALSHPFGIGNALFRTGSKEPVFTDTVPFGCFKKNVFDRIGAFDEELLRNQDDELNGRIIRSGGRILLVPAIRTKYFARPTRKLTWKMYYQYGFYKPLVIRKLGKPATLRQCIPPLMVGGIGGALLLTLLFPFLYPLFAVPAISYIAGVA